VIPGWLQRLPGGGKPFAARNFPHTDWNPRFLFVSTGLEAAHICCLGGMFDQVVCCIQVESP
jgi:hypothetical protein